MRYVVIFRGLYADVFTQQIGSLVADDFISVLYIAAWVGVWNNYNHGVVWTCLAGHDMHGLIYISHLLYLRVSHAFSCQFLYIFIAFAGRVLHILRIHVFFQACFLEGLSK